MSEFTIKQGATFALSGVYTDTINGNSLAGITLTSQIRNRVNDLVATLQVTITDEVNGICEFVASETLTWPVGLLYWDIKVTHVDYVRLTVTKEFTVLRARTLV